MVEERFLWKKTLLVNIGLLVKGVFNLVLFVIGLKAIVIFEDPLMVLFLILIWCYIFLTHFRFNPRLIFENKKGEREEYY